MRREKKHTRRIAGCLLQTSSREVRGVLGRVAGPAAESRGLEATQLCHDAAQLPAFPDLLL